MPFTITDRDIRQYDSTTILRCDDCGGTERVYDQPLDDAAMDEAERLHEHVPMCCACGEPIDAASISGFSCSPCLEDDHEGTLAAMVAYTKSAPTGEWLARMRDSGARLDRSLAASPLAS